MTLVALVYKHYSGGSPFSLNTKRVERSIILYANNTNAGQVLFHHDTPNCQLQQ